MQALSLNKHLLIEGNAGTGKTLLAVDFAKKKAASRKKFFFLHTIKILQIMLSDRLILLKILR